MVAFMLSPCWMLMGSWNWVRTVMHLLVLSRTHVPSCARNSTYPSYRSHRAWWMTWKYTIPNHHLCATKDILTFVFPWKCVFDYGCEHTQFFWRMQELFFKVIHINLVDWLAPALLGLRQYAQTIPATARPDQYQPKIAMPDNTLLRWMRPRNLLR